MNILPPELREKIALLRAAGVGVREIARELDVKSETVSSIVGYKSRDRKEILRLLEALWVTIEVNPKRTDVPVDVELALEDLYGYVVCTCPLHPEDKSPDQMTSLTEDGVCLGCRRDGLKRHHARHKAAGTPIVPPWRRKTDEPQSETPKPPIDWRLL